MEYRELQEKCKARGLKAHGKKDVLIERLMADMEAAQEMDDLVAPAEVQRIAQEAVETVNGEGLPEFIFVGDDGNREYWKRVRVGWDDDFDKPIYGEELHNRQVNPNNPARITMRSGIDVPIEERKEYRFVLHGDPVQVDDSALAEKLRKNHHFKEV